LFGLPRSTDIKKPLPKKAIFDRFKPRPDDRKLFDEQINRLVIAAEISPQTLAVNASLDVSAIYLILVSLKTPECDKKNIALLSKLIDQRMLFVLQYEDTVRLAVHRAESVLVSESKPLHEWKLSLRGLDLGAIWENIIAEIGSIDLTEGKSLDDTIVANERREKLKKKIAALEKKAMNEKQPRRKWELVEEVKRLKNEMEELTNG
jgi:hypothetical protein